MNEMTGFSPADASPAVVALEDGGKRETRTGLLIAGAFFVGFLGIAAVTPLDAGAYAEGVVAVSGSKQAVQHRDGGIVTAIHVSEGKQVTKGQPLLQVTAPELIAAERGATSQVITLLAARARLVAEAGRASAVDEPVEYGQFIGSDKALAAQALHGQRMLFEARRSALGTERNVLGQRLRQHSEQVGGVRHQMRANKEQQRLIKEELAGLNELVGKGFVSKNRIREMERMASQLDGNYGAYQADTARTFEAMGETRLEIVSLDKHRLTEVAAELQEVQSRLDELQPKLLSLREQLARSTVRAPESGRVVGLTVFTVGGVIAAGATVMEIVPQDRDLIIEGKVSPTDADDLRLGMSTQIRFTALQERNLPILRGTISKVSADSLEDERTGQRYFKIEVVVPPAELSKVPSAAGNPRIRTGLPADVMIPLRKRTALAYIIEPLTQTLWLAGREN